MYQQIHITAEPNKAFMKGEIIYFFAPEGNRQNPEARDYQTASTLQERVTFMTQPEECKHMT